jgi:hypothetical protein
MADKPQAKRIVVCFDGTAQQIGAGNLTNVAKLFELVEKNDPASQLAYYDPGQQLARLPRCVRPGLVSLRNRTCSRVLEFCPQLLA